MNNNWEEKQIDIINIVEKALKIYPDIKAKHRANLIQCLFDYFSKTLKDREEEILKCLPNKKGKKGLIKMVFGNGEKFSKPIETNYDYGFNSCREEFLNNLNS